MCQFRSRPEQAGKRCWPDRPNLLADRAPSVIGHERGNVCRSIDSPLPRPAAWLCATIPLSIYDPLFLEDAIGSRFREEQAWHAVPAHAFTTCTAWCSCAGAGWAGPCRSAAWADAAHGLGQDAAASMAGCSVSMKRSIVVSPISTDFALPPATTVTSVMPMTPRMSRRYWVAMSRSRIGESSV